MTGKATKGLADLPTRIRADIAIVSTVKANGHISKLPIGLVEIIGAACNLNELKALRASYPKIASHHGATGLPRGFGPL